MEKHFRLFWFYLMCTAFQKSVVYHVWKIETSATRRVAVDPHFVEALPTSIKISVATRFSFLVHSTSGETRRGSINRSMSFLEQWRFFRNPSGIVNELLHKRTEVSNNLGLPELFVCSVRCTNQWLLHHRLKLRYIFWRYIWSEGIVCWIRKR